MTPLRSSMSQFHTVIWATIGIAQASSKAICSAMRDQVGMLFMSTASPTPTAIVAVAVTAMKATDLMRTAQNSASVSSEV